MIIDLKTILEESCFQEVFAPSWWQPDNQILSFQTPLRVEVKISRVGGKYILKGDIAGNLTIRCDRCLESFPWNLKSSFQVFLAIASPGSEKEDIELLDEDVEAEYIQGEIVDLDALIREQIFLALPMKSICRENCRGFCPVCGTNLNESVCQCQKEVVHPAFSKLKNLKIKGESKE